MAAFDPARHLDTLAPALGLVIDPAWRAEVEQFLATAARMAALVEDFPPGAELEHMAPVFRPGDRP